MRSGLREANQPFSRIVRAVREGREVVLTDRGRPVAVGRPLPEAANGESALALAAIVARMRLDRAYRSSSR
jgi:antitoxin (DNA-binding transcriptional repressor) of toxin-antitoxin stability system